MLKNSAFKQFIIQMYAMHIELAIKSMASQIIHNLTVCSTVRPS